MSYRSTWGRIADAVRFCEGLGDDLAIMRSAASNADETIAERHPEVVSVDEFRALCDTEEWCEVAVEGFRDLGGTMPPL